MATSVTRLIKSVSSQSENIQNKLVPRGQCGRVSAGKEACFSACSMLIRQQGRGWPLNAFVAMCDQLCWVSSAVVFNF